MEKKLNDLIDKALSRRKFMAGAGTTAAAALIVGCSNSNPAPTTTPTPTPTPKPLDIPDNDILNFALNLEYLEAEFYLYAATGSGLSSKDALTGAGTTKVPANTIPVPWTNSTFRQYANEIAQDELDHVRAIQAAITGNKGTPVPRPNIDLTFFGPLAVAASITTDPTAFNPFASNNAFLVGAFIFEDVGVTAYTGAAPLLTSNAILSAAAGIQATEAYHAAEIRTLLVGNAANSGDQTYVGFANKVSALRATLGGGAETMLSATSIVAADSNAIAFGRTTDQVLHIVYGAPGVGLAKGGFFPNGLNGTITATAS
ncbi:MAG: ferritin-like domain-containing protein [Acidobacteriota bacterium]|nr:ferritin-like domain-containing protein [Acidobacteriota bacterium]